MSNSTIVRLILLALAAIHCATSMAQHLTFEEWRAKGLQDMRLLPRFGDLPMNTAQRANQEEFVQLMLSNPIEPREASDQLVELGFDLLRQGDMTKAMYRFNQGFLLDSTNANVYRGYGTFFMELNNVAMAHTMYRAGLSLDSTYAPILTAEGTAYMADHHANREVDVRVAKDALNNALVMFRRAERHAPEDADLLYRMAAASLLKDDCDNAVAYWQRCQQAGGKALEVDFEERLRRRCGTGR